MALTEDTRHHMFQALERQLGAEEAATLMEHLPPVGWADVATKHDLDHLATVTRADIANLGTVLGARIDMLATVLGARIDTHDGRFDQVDRRFDQVDRRFDEVNRRFGQMDARFDRLETGLVAVHTSIDALHHAQSTFLRQLTLALFVALVSILVAAVGLR